MMSILIWIPCERSMPPKEEKEYLITVLDYDGTEKERKRVLIATYSVLKIVDGKARWAFRQKVANGSYIFTNAIAWAHMPDPYDGEPEINLNEFLTEYADKYGYPKKGETYDY